jgi:hypothetical protein
MKTYLLAAALALSNAHAISTSYWGEDTPDAFSFTVWGTGLNFSETLTSPTGLWQMTANIKAVPILGPGIPIYEFDDWGTARYFGHPDNPMLIAEMYHDTMRVQEGQQIFDGQSFMFVRDGSWDATLHDDGTITPGGYLTEWSGLMPMLITVGDPLDLSTWNWVLNVFAHGPEYTRAVPDYGNGALCLAAAAGILFIFRRP